MLAAWLSLFCGMALAVAGNIAVKQSNGYENMKLGATALAFFLLCNILYGMGVKTLPLGIATAVWMGVVTLSSVVASHFLFGERINLISGTLILVIIICSAALVALVKS